MKKILFLITSLGGGGAERVLVNLVNMLPKDKYDITVQTLFDVGVNRNYLGKNIKYISGFPWQFRGNTKVMSLIPRKILYKKLVREKYDIVVSFLEGPTARIVSGCDKRDTKLVCWIHVEQNNTKCAAGSFFSYKEALQSYMRYDKIVCVSETVKQDFLSLFPVRNSVEVLYNVNDTDKILQLADAAAVQRLLSDQLNIVSVGRLIPQKGYDRLISIHAKLIAEGYLHHLYLLGNGNDETKLKAIAHNLGVSETVHFMGFQDNPYQYVAQADLFVCSSRREGFSTAVTESLVLGVPVVSTSCSGAYELLGKSNEYGIVTDNNEDSLYDGIRKMLQSDVTLAHYRTMAKQRGKELTSEVTLKSVENMLDNL